LDQQLRQQCDKLEPLPEEVPRQILVAPGYFHVHARVLSVSRQDRPRRTRSRCCAKKVFKPSACVICLDSQLLRT
jgi:hypothetical protein